MKGGLLIMHFVLKFIENVLVMYFVYLRPGVCYLQYQKTISPAVPTLADRGHVDLCSFLLQHKRSGILADIFDEMAV